MLLVYSSKITYFYEFQCVSNGGADLDRKLSEPFSKFQLGIYFYYKNIFMMKNLTDLRKTDETVVDARLITIKVNQ